MKTLSKILTTVALAGVFIGAGNYKLKTSYYNEGSSLGGDHNFIERYDATNHSKMRANDYAGDGEFDELVVRRSDEFTIYVNRDTIDRFPDVENYRKTWCSDANIVEVGSEQLEEMVNSLRRSQ